ncbi:MAG: PAS domain S-box protein [Candidatus Heimdallarchaeota archaeon]
MSSKKKGKKKDEVIHLFEHNGISLGKLTLEETRKLIAAKEELFYSLYELTNDAVFIINLKGEYLLVNQRAADLLGYTIKEMIGKSAISFTAPGDREDALTRLSSIQKGQVVPIYERNLCHKDGTIIPVELNIAIVTNKKGEPLYIQSAARDIRSRKKMEEQQGLLQKQRDELDSFASNVAHDIRGKLQVISLYNELMADNIYSEKIAEQISEMVRFLDNSLLLAKKGEIVGEFRKFALDELLADLLAKVRSLKPNMTITVKNLPVVKGDREKLNQVFENLLMNIVKHSHATEVKIYSKEKNGYHCIHVVDNGVGMSKKIQEKIIRAWNTKIYTTFGLMIVKKIIDAHNGSITFKSKLNQGSTFIIKLPKA